MKLFLSCEHGGNQVPEKYNYLFENSYELLNSHNGYDNGALELFKILQTIENVEFSICNEITRLLVDCNRSITRPTLFSAFTKRLNKKEKHTILESYYYPYRNKFRKKLNDFVFRGDSVFHISVHAFAPEVDGKVRDADIGLLFNPNHGIEQWIGLYWRRILQRIFPDLKIRLNYPFMGTPDGMVAPLRKEFNKKYAGFELEMNSKHAGNIMIYNGIKESVEKLLKLIEF